MAYTPLFQAGPLTIYPEIFTKFARSTYHLSQPAPGRGSSGVHEYGFGCGGPYQRPSVDDLRIPQLPVVDDTFTRYKGEMEAVIGVAKEYARKHNLP